MPPTAEEEALVLVSDHDAVRVVTLNRPHIKNAIDLPLRVALAEALEAASSEPTVRAIVLTGAGSAFCSGGDISTMARQPADLTRPRAQAAQRVIRAIWRSRKPVVAAVEGPAFGAGTALALACDRVVAARDSIFGTTFTGVGLAGDMGIFSSLPERIGVPAAKQLLMLPRRISGTEAQAMGMVDSVVDPGTALESAMSDARRLADGPPLALAVIKSSLGSALIDRFDVLELEVVNQSALFDTDDFEEGVAAFRERRTPRFVGS